MKPNIPLYSANSRWHLTVTCESTYNIAAEYNRESGIGTPSQVGNYNR